MRPDWRASSPNSFPGPRAGSSPDEKESITAATLATSRASLQSPAATTGKLRHCPERRGDRQTPTCAGLPADGSTLRQCRPKRSGLRSAAPCLRFFGWAGQLPLRCAVLSGLRTARPMTATLTICAWTLPLGPQPKGSQPIAGQEQVPHPGWVIRTQLSADSVILRRRRLTLHTPSLARASGSAMDRSTPCFVRA